MTGEGDMAKYIASRFKKRPAEDSDRGGGAQFNRSCKSTRKWANGAIFFFPVLHCRDTVNTETLGLRLQCCGVGRLANCSIQPLSMSTLGLHNV